MDSYKTIIEIGSFSIKTIIYSELNKEFSIIGTGKTRSKGYTGQEIENFDDFIESIKNSIVQAEKQANYIIKDAYILITNQSVKIKKTQKDLMLNGTIIEKNDSLFMVLGSPGGSSIITAVFQTVLNVIDYKMDVQSAVNAPRFHHQWKPDYIKLENDFKENDSLILSLKKKGHTVRFVSSMNRVDAILVNLDSLYGGADKRGDDYAASY